MKNLTSVTRALLLGGAFLAVGALATASAQDAGGFGLSGMSSRTKMSTSCPAIEWHVAPIVGGMLNGVAFYNDMSGISVIHGSIAKDGTINASLVSIRGNGPAGTVSGKRTATEAKGKLEGAGCANASFDMVTWTVGPHEGM